MVADVEADTLASPVAVAELEPDKDEPLISVANAPAKAAVVKLVFEPPITNCPLNVPPAALKSPLNVPFPSLSNETTVVSVEPCLFIISKFPSVSISNLDLLSPI